MFSRVKMALNSTGTVDTKPSKRMLGNAFQPANKPARQAERAVTYSYQLLVFFLVSAVLHGWGKTGKQGKRLQQGVWDIPGERTKKTSWQVPIHRTGADSLGKSSHSGYVMARKKWLNGIALSCMLINILMFDHLNTS